MFSSDTVKIALLPKNKAELLEDFYYENDYYKITVKPGFVFDGASIPKFFWRLIGHPFSYKLIRAALIHDILYATEYLNRQTADDLFSAMLDESDVLDWKEYLMYTAVRVGGEDVWDNHTEEGIVDALTYIEVVEM